MKKTEFILIIILVISLGVYTLYFLTQNKNYIHFVDNINKTTNQKSNLANPASINCKKQGGTTVIKTRGDGGEYGLCYFEDDMACEEWALMRGTCPKGGVKTIGYDNEEQMYCAWLGGKTFAEPNATCTLPSGEICTDTELYNGSCPTN